MRRELQRISIGTFTGPAGTFRRHTDLPKTARDLLTALDNSVSRKIHELTTPESEPGPFPTSRRLETRPAASRPAITEGQSPIRGSRRSELRGTRASAGGWKGPEIVTQIVTTTADSAVPMSACTWAPVSSATGSTTSDCRNALMP